MDRSGEELGFSFARFADGFDRHIRQSIRGYADLLSDCAALSEYFVENGTVVFDIGCSTGSFLREVWSKTHERCPEARYIGVDVEPSFRSFWQGAQADNMELQLADVRSYPIPGNCSFVTSIFSLQFIPEGERQKVLDKIYQALLPGGALIIAEKVFCKVPKLNDMLTFIHYDFKRRSFTEAEILAKERSLRSKMKLWTEPQVIGSLASVGFAPDNVQCFWRNHNFAAFVALK
ncbi:MAG TPA: methyltransferase domain-containing protein [Stellaceae bacterium]|nr:methyltransferase domain-containing protein [Stellaceae bacterium]